MMLFEEQIKKYEYKLNDTDEQIIEYILKNKEEAVNLSIQNLAAKHFTVPNTITRLSKKLGYEGYSQMKISLKEEINQKKEPMKDSLSFNLHKTLSIIDRDKLVIVTKMIQEANRVLCFAVGDTTPFCEIIVKYLKIAGKQAEHYYHRHDMIHEVNHLEATDVLFLISLSGETSQVLDIAEIAKKRGVRLISLTHFYKNSLQQMADANLYCYSPNRKFKEYNITDKTPVMIVLRALAEIYWAIEK
ncbi:MurR/RpiR family transcriptional regulator [Brevibacillus laterosporus]|uniref:MurR/RpiR family transcriptional regulator n=1 Tax=Brevibacillus laterosporus TaxID=1465 RepID=UPI001443C5D5|nr:MurR/RpiR family transcriptional regulator [Brevibacillus laterosporus]NKQ18708.1 MurR/RpiR family transcriptional regulator [Brevibacillus laterosporus]WNX33474.1 MurR/RpiR family transcriptional regulator [Brevibacillus laterosporus]